MPSLRILVPIHTMPNIKSVTVVFFENLLPVLKTMTDVHMIWLVYMPEKLSSLVQKNPGTTILDIHNYKNALEIIQKEKPDVIYAVAAPSFIDYALSSAAKFLNIPVFSMFWSDWYYLTTSKAIKAKLNITRFFESSVPTDINQNQKKFMRRGRFYVYKYLFLLKTQMSIRMSRLKILENFFMLLKHNLVDVPTNSQFANTIHFLEDKKLQSILLDAGFEKSSLVVTGNPLFDTALQNSHKSKKYDKKDNKIRVLLAPSTLYEHGFWTREQRDTTIKEIITKILEKKNKISVAIKIHPSTSFLSEYRSLTNSIDPSIPVYQKGNIQEFLENTDVVITFQSSTAEMYAVIARKPIIMCNFFNDKKDIMVEKGMALECKVPSQLIELIHQAISNPDYEQKRENFIKEFMYEADGHAAERICNEIIKLLEKRHD